MFVSEYPNLLASYFSSFMFLLGHADPHWSNVWEKQTSIVIINQLQVLKEGKCQAEVIDSHQWAAVSTCLPLLRGLHWLSQPQSHKPHLYLQIISFTSAFKPNSNLKLKTKHIFVFIDYKDIVRWHWGCVI